MLNGVVADKKLPQINQERDIKALQVSAFITAIALTGIFTYLATTMRVRSAGFAVSATMAGVGGVGMVLTAISMVQHARKVLEFKEKQKKRGEQEVRAHGGAHDAQPAAPRVLAAAVEEPEVKEKPAAPAKADAAELADDVAEEDAAELADDVAEEDAAELVGDVAEEDAAAETGDALSQLDTPVILVGAAEIKKMAPPPTWSSRTSDLVVGAAGLAASAISGASDAVIQPGEIDRKMGRRGFVEMVRAAAPFLELNEDVTAGDTLAEMLRKIKTARVIREREQESFLVKGARILPTVITNWMDYKDEIPQHEALLRPLIDAFTMFVADLDKPQAIRKQFFKAYNDLYAHAVNSGDLQKYLNDQSQCTYVGLLLKLARVQVTTPVWNFAEEALEKASGGTMNAFARGDRPLSEMLESLNKIKAPLALVGWGKQGLKLQSNANVAFNPFETHNPPYQIGTINQKLNWLRHPVPTKELAAEQVEIVPMFRAFLLDCRLKGQKVISFQLQNRCPKRLADAFGEETLEGVKSGSVGTAFKGLKKGLQNEAHRTAAMDELSEQFKDVLMLVYLPLDGEWVEQEKAGDHAAQFVASFKDQLDGPSFVVPEDDKQNLKTIVERVHTHIFEGKDELTFEERRAFIALAYSYFERYLLVKHNPDFFSNQCKDSKDRAGMLNTLLLTVRFAEEGKLRDTAIRKYAHMLAQFASLMAVGETMSSGRFKHMIHAIKYLEAHPEAVKSARKKVFEGLGIDGDDLSQFVFSAENEPPLEPVFHEPKIRRPVIPSQVKESEYKGALMLANGGFVDFSEHLKALNPMGEFHWDFSKASFIVNGDEIGDAETLDRLLEEITLKEKAFLSVDMLTRLSSVVERHYNNEAAGFAVHEIDDERFLPRVEILWDENTHVREGVSSKVFAIKNSEQSDVAYLRVDCQVDFTAETARLFFGRPLISKDLDDVLELYNQRPKEKELPFKAENRDLYLKFLDKTEPGMVLLKDNPDDKLTSVINTLAPLFKAHGFELRNTQYSENIGNQKGYYFQITDGYESRFLKVEIEWKPNEKLFSMRWSRPAKPVEGKKAYQIGYVMLGGEDPKWEEV
jgi:hypothetical protein